MKKILVIDDDHDVLYTTKKAIKYGDKQYKVITLDSGEKLLESLKFDIPDLILLDIMMPDMDGWNVFNKIKSNPKCMNIPIIFISSIADDKSIQKANELGDDFIEKPFTQDILLDKIKNIFK